MRHSALCIALITALIHTTGLAQESFVLTESSLLGALQSQPPELARLKALESQARADEAEEREAYGWKFFTQVGYQNSEEKALAPFIPTFGPSYFTSLGISKSFPAGIDLEARAFADQQSSADRVIDEATRSGFQIRASLDLWKNLLGRVDRASLQSLTLQRDKEELLRKLNSRVFELELRKLYWALVANQEQRLVSEELLASAQYQLKEGVARGTQYIADKGEIARYRAQVGDRETTLLLLEYQRSLLLQRLKELLPSLASKSIVLGSYEKDSFSTQVMGCADIIARQQAVPWENTPLDDVLRIVEKDFRQQQLETARYSDIDLKLQSMLQLSGVDQGYSNSFDDFTSHGQPGVEIGLRLDIPLDRSLGRTKAARLEADYQNFIAEKQRLQGSVEAHHSQIFSLIKALADSVRTLDENTDNLRTTIIEDKRKFKQARVSVNELVQNDDALLRGLLTRIDAKLKGIQTLLDYFKVFPDTPCTINRLAAES